MSVERIDEQGHLIPGEYRLMGAATTGESLHRAFRPAMGEDYEAEIRRILSEGAGLTHLIADGKVGALALWRVFYTTYCGRRFEVDDLVTADGSRSRGHGATLLNWLEGKARDMDCPTLTLNSGTHRTDAHRFYHRQRYPIIAFHFSKDLGTPGPSQVGDQP